MGQKQESIAAKQRDIALEAISNRTYEWIEALIQIPRTQEIVNDILEDNTKLLDKIHALSPNKTETLREKTVSLSKQGDVQLQLGNTDQALQAYQQSLEISQKLAKYDPQQLHRPTGFDVQSLQNR